MTELKIKLDNLDNVNAFVDIAQRRDYDVDLMQGRYLVNAKSIMGVFSLDLTKPLILKFQNDDAEFLKEIEDYIITE